MDSMRLLLISTSAVHGTGYLDHAETEIRSFLGAVRRLLFVPFALYDHNAYAHKARQRFAQMGYEVTSLHQVDDMGKAIRAAEAVFVGGGNTFRLLKSLYDFEVLRVIGERVRSGMPYIGSSAGSNVACPTIRTTNDMPIVEPPSLAALNLFPYQINPHYLDRDARSTHLGETREERLLQYLEENEIPVVGLREGAMIRCENGEAMLKGTHGARIFKRALPPFELEPGANLRLG
jgi:dipeptidase E